jgi:hypothetical protein
VEKKIKREWDINRLSLLDTNVDLQFEELESILEIEESIKMCYTFQQEELKKMSSNVEAIKNYRDKVKK